MMRTLVGLVAIAAVLLTGCAGDGDVDGERGGGKGGGPLKGLDGDALCAMVDRATIEKQFNDPVRNALGGKEPPGERETVSCKYVTDSLLNSDVKDAGKALSIGTRVRPARDGMKTAKEALDAYMVDWDAKTVDYQRVEGLGAAAGYASSELKVPLGENHLVAILDIDGSFIEVSANSEPVGTLDQLRPIADQLVKGVEAKLR